MRIRVLLFLKEDRMFTEAVNAVVSIYPLARWVERTGLAAKRTTSKSDLSHMSQSLYSIPAS